MKINKILCICCYSLHKKQIDSAINIKKESDMNMKKLLVLTGIASILCVSVSTVGETCGNKPCETCAKKHTHNCGK